MALHKTVDGGDLS